MKIMDMGQKVFYMMSFFWPSLLKLHNDAKSVPEYEEIENILNENEKHSIDKHQTFYTTCMEFIDAYHDEGEDAERWYQDIKLSIMKEVKSLELQVLLLRMLNE